MCSRRHRLQYSEHTVKRRMQCTEGKKGKTQPGVFREFKYRLQEDGGTMGLEGLAVALEGGCGQQ